MLIGIIKNKNKEYYVHRKDNKICVLYANDDIVRPLSKLEAIHLYNDIFSSKLRLYAKEDDYDVYLDENNHKRYFKDGLEDLTKFFTINGFDGLEYKMSYEKKVRLTKVMQKITTAEYLLIVLIASTFSNHREIVYDPEPFYSEIQEASAETVTDDILKELLYSSNDLSMDDKDFLCNEDLLRLVTRMSSNGRNYSLREKFNNINVKYFTIDEEERYDKITGFYDPLEPSTLHVRDDMMTNTNKYNDVLAHEFIHLLQTNNQYRYINEGCAEILSNEYYGQVNNSYNEIVKRVKVLMEIIGPKPIIECNFNNNTEIFESYVGRYLNNEEKTNLLELFMAKDVDLCENKEVKELNNKIDVLLSKMYFNKTGKDIKDDLMISIIYSVCIDDRYYFNDDKEEYTNDYILNHNREEIDIIPLDDAVNSNNVLKYEWHKNCIFIKNDHQVHGYTVVETTDFNQIHGEKDEFIIVFFKDGTNGEIRFNYDRNDWSDVYHYRITPNYEPSIIDKFPGQTNELNFDSHKTM